MAIGRRSPNMERDQFAELKTAEARMLRDYITAKLLLHAAYCEDFTCVLFIWNTDSAKEAEQFIQSLPSAKSGIFSYDVTPLFPLPELRNLLVLTDHSCPGWWKR